MYPGLVKSTGLVLAEKPSIGIEPTRLTDRSRFGNHGTHSNITLVQLPRGLWVRSYNNTDSRTLSIGLPIPDAWTINAWINRPSGRDTVFAFKAGVFPRIGFGMGTGNNEANIIRGTNNYQKFSSETEFSIWQMITFTVPGAAQADITSAQYFRSAVSITQGDGDNSGAATAMTNVLYTGNTSANNDPYNGLMVLVKMWAYVLSAGKILKIFNAERHWFGV